VRAPETGVEGLFVKITLAEFADLDTLRDTLFGWAKGSWTGAEEAYDGLLGEAHHGTLFLDEIHHLDRKLQPLLLGPLNTDSLGSRRYKPKMATYDVISDFDLVVATNDPAWRDRMIPDLQERFERIVIEVPSFRSFQKDATQTIWQFWEFTLRRRCERCGLEYTQEGDWKECSQRLLELFASQPLHGNWRDLQRLADNTLLYLTDARDGRPTALTWNLLLLEDAIRRTFGRGTSGTNTGG
jgi:transcriptional regulator with AAA-type ATPase domain